MKALVLSGGTGTRLRPLSHAMAKQLVPVANKPVLFCCLEDIAAAGIEDVGIVVGSRAEEIAGAVGDGRDFGLRLTYLPQDRPRGLAHAVAVARGFLGEDDFVLYLGDNVLRGGISGIVADFRARRPIAQIAVIKAADLRQGGAADLDADGRVRGVEEKADQPRGAHLIIGVYVFTAGIHEAIDAIAPSRRGELEITDAIQLLIEKGAPVRAHTYRDYWVDVGQVESALACNRVLLAGIQHRIDGELDDASIVTGQVRVEAGAAVRGTRIVGPAIIGPGAVVTDCRIGPGTSVGAGCVLTGAWTENTILMRDAAVRGLQIRDSLIGRGATVRPGGGGHRLVVCDDCDLELLT